MGLPLLTCATAPAPLPLLSGEGVLKTEETTAEATTVLVLLPLGGGESFRVRRLRGLVRVGRRSLETKRLFFNKLDTNLRYKAD